VEMGLFWLLIEFKSCYCHSLLESVTGTGSGTTVSATGSGVAFCGF